MNLKKTTLAFAIAAMASAPMFASADVKLGGVVRVDLTDTDEVESATDEDSLDISVSKARLWTKAVDEVGGVKYHGQIEIDLDDEVNDDNDTENDVDVRTARIVATGGFGALVFGKTASGTFADTVGQTDVLEHNSAKFWNQGSRSNNAFAWKTPNMGPVYAVLVAVADDNEGWLEGEDVDATAARLVYKAHGVKVGVGFVDLTDNRTRTLLGASYASGPFSVAAGFESIDWDADTLEDQETVSVTATFSAGKIDITPYYEQVENRGGTDGSDDDVVALNLTYNISKATYVYFETATFDVDDQDNTSIGISTKF